MALFETQLMFACGRRRRRRNCQIKIRGCRGNMNRHVFRAVDKFLFGGGGCWKERIVCRRSQDLVFQPPLPRGDGDVHPWSDSAHPQECHMRLGAKSHDGSLIQDKALGAGRHYAPCSRSLGSMSSGCLLTRRSGTPPERKAAQSFHWLHLSLTHTADLL